MQKLGIRTIKFDFVLLGLDVVQVVIKISTIRNHRRDLQWGAQLQPKCCRHSIANTKFTPILTITLIIEFTVEI